MVGPSDSGKTAILRALDWLCFNFGRVVLLQRRGADYVSVTLDVDGHKVTRSSRNNSYQIDDMQFKTINKTIPPEVSNLLHVSEDNVQRQHDYLFWFTASGSALVSNLNRVVDLSKLEDWVHIGVNKERVCKDEATYHTTRKSELEQSISDLSCYRDMDRDLVVLESMYADLGSKRQRLNDLERSIDDLNKIDSRRVLCENYINNLNVVITGYEEICEKRDELMKLSECLSRYIDIEERVWLYEELCAIPLNCDEILNKRERVSEIVLVLTRIDSLDNAVNVLNNASGIYEECCEVVRKSDDYNSLMEVLICLRSLNTSIDKSDITIEEIRREITEKSEGRCPICGGVLDLETDCG